MKFNPNYTRADYLHELLLGLPNFTLDQTNDELSRRVEEYLENGGLVVDFEIRDTHQGAVFTKKAIEHAVYLDPELNRINHRLVPVTPISSDRHVFPLSGIYIRDESEKDYVIYNVAPQDSDLVYSIEVERNLATKNGSIVMYFANNTE